MIKYFCDRCGKEMDKPYSHISYSGDSASLCKGCFDEILNWMKNNPVEDKPVPVEDKPVKECKKNIIEGYEKIIHEYQQQIIDLTENLDKTRGNRDLWFNHCKELAKECNALHNKADEIMIQGGVR